MPTGAVRITEAGPRDGVQHASTSPDTSAELADVEHLITAGLTRIDVTGFAHPRLVPQMADAEALMAHPPRPAGVSDIHLVLDERGLDPALGSGVHEVNVAVVSAVPH